MECIINQRTCQNPECGKKYDASSKDADPDYCSFDCWEKMNCKVPPEIHFEELEVMYEKKEKV